MSEKIEMQKTYNPSEVEDGIYKKWEESGYFNPDNLDLPDNAPTYTIVLPPPNITDKLHLGHAAMLAIEDLLIRYHRMNGYRALWIPGTDHAAIATQNVVEKKLLKEEGLTRHDLGREKFLERVWEFLRKTQSTILHQTRKMGASLDWSREAFTLDEPRVEAVQKMFIDMYEAGVIYRGERIVNWCPRCHSTLADDEVEYKAQKAKLYTFRYDKDFPIPISTTRPETKLGDTAVAVNPEGKYKEYIGGEPLKANFCGIHLELKVIADRNVDVNFGTGAVGVTPAHSMADWQMAQENDLEIIKVIGEDGKIKDGFAEYSGKGVEEAREMVTEKLRENNLMENEEEMENNLSVCYRCGAAVEPLPSKQWFVSVDKKVEKLGNKSLKEKAIEVAESGEIKFIPDRFEKRYLDWMKNLHDWCISRQIWFGHRIPVFYDLKAQKNNLGRIFFKKNSVYLNDEQIKRQGELKGLGPCGRRGENMTFAGFNVVAFWIEQKWFTKENIIKSAVNIDTSGCEEYRVLDSYTKSNEYEIQDPDTLDTWFSSGMWTFSTLGWPENFKNGKKSGDLAKFHPTQVLETGYEILTLWVSRMIMMSLFAVGEIPFHNVYLHGMILDKHGKKMSKSKGNGIDPIDMIDKFGTDAVRLSLLMGSTPGNDARLSEEKIEGFRNFTNKIWNIARYIIGSRTDEYEEKNIEPQNFSRIDLWILKKMATLILNVNHDLFKYNFSSAGERLYDFTWNDFADWYIEASKFEKNGQKEIILNLILNDLLKLWHPFIPFVTETIWQKMGNEKFLMIEEWPDFNSYDEIIHIAYESDLEKNGNFEPIQKIIIAIRNARSENSIEPSKKVKAMICAGERKELVESQAHLIKNLKTGIEELEITLPLTPSAGGGTSGTPFAKGGKIENAIYTTVGGIDIYLIGAIDFGKEKERIAGEIEEVKKYIKQIEGKLNNQEFINNAPEAVVGKEREKLAAQKERLEKLEGSLGSLQ